MTPRLLTIAEARARVLKSTRALGTEPVAIAAALDRVLAEDVAAAGDVPPFPASAMDGYAIHSGPRDRTLSIIGESRAGAPFGAGLSRSQAVRISTGGAVPSGATAVVRQEDVTASDGMILTHAALDPGENIRPAGDVIRSGTTILPAGTVVKAPELAVAIAAGAGRLTVAKRPAVAVLSTGDELRPPGEPLALGEIHNSNGPMLVALAARCGAATGTSSQLPDDREATQAALADALDADDVVIVCGGVSVGPHDHVKAALAALAVAERFWGVALQPGKPTWFGVAGAKLVFGLPGNPVSAAVTFSLFVAPALAALQGAGEPHARYGAAVLAATVRRNPHREQAIRVRLEQRETTVFAHPNGPQGSHVVTSLLGADALALIPPGEGQLPDGATVALAPLIS